jgi:hypothetical protein
MQATFGPGSDSRLDADQKLAALKELSNSANDAVSYGREG